MATGSKHPKTLIVSLGGDGWHWRRVAPNGRKQYTSGEPFDTKSNAVRAARNHAQELETPVRIFVDYGNGELKEIDP
jgi:hypothetical protein